MHSAGRSLALEYIVRSEFAIIGGCGVSSCPQSATRGGYTGWLAEGTLHVVLIPRFHASYIRIVGHAVDQPANCKAVAENP